MALGKNIIFNFQVLLGILLALLPCALVSCFIYISFGSTIFDFMPHYDLDQFIYWREMATFAKSGFGGGHYGVNEIPSVLKGFGPHGVAIGIVYGVFYKLMPGLDFAFIPVFNVLLLTASLVTYVLVLRPFRLETALGCLAIALFPPAFLYLPTSFQDGLHCGAAVFLALMFIRMIKTADSPGEFRVRALVGVFLLLLCFLRYTWSFAFIPYFYILLSGRRWRLLLSVALTVVVTLAVIKIFNLFVPGWYISSESGVHLAGKSLGEMAEFMLKRASGNIHALLDYKNNNASTAVLAGLFLFAIFFSLLFLYRASWGKNFTSPNAVLFLVVFINLMLLPGIFILFWMGSGIHLVRLLSANYVFCFILVLHFSSWRAPCIFILYFALLMPMYMNIFQIYHLPGNINSDERRKVQIFKGQVAPFFESLNAENAWDKTIFVQSRSNGLACLGLPPQLGIQIGVGDFSPRKSRFALTASPLDAPQWAVLAQTELGYLCVRMPESGSLPCQNEVAAR